MNFTQDSKNLILDEMVDNCSPIQKSRQQLVISKPGISFFVQKQNEVFLKNDIAPAQAKPSTPRHSTSKIIDKIKLESEKMDHPINPYNILKQAGLNLELYTTAEKANKKNQKVNPDIISRKQRMQEKESKESKFQMSNLENLKKKYNLVKTYGQGKDLARRIFEMQIDSTEKYVVGEDGALVVCLNRINYDKLYYSVNTKIKDKFKDIWMKFPIFRFWEVRNAFEDLQKLILPFCLSESSYLFKKGDAANNIYILMEGEVEFKKVKFLEHLGDNILLDGIRSLDVNMVSKKQKKKYVEFNRYINAPYLISEIDLKTKGKLYDFSCKIRKGPALFIKLSRETIKHSIIRLNPMFRKNLEQIAVD
jgi:hypothetical protein